MDLYKSRLKIAQMELEELDDRYLLVQLLQLLLQLPGRERGNPEQCYHHLFQHQNRRWHQVTLELTTGFMLV